MSVRPDPRRSVGEPSEPSVPEAVVAAAQRAERDLLGARHDIEQAIALVPATAGLYAVWADEEAWTALGLRPASDHQPLYVGSREQSARARSQHAL
jgi:hypothetical protein